MTADHDAIYIVDGARTPFLKARGRPGPFSAADLATASGTQLLLRQPFAADELDEVILGCATPASDEANIGRIAALRMGCGTATPGWTVMRNCASGLQAIDSALANIRLGRSDLVLAGGVDALSRAPVLVPDDMVHWLARWRAARSAGERCQLLRHLRPRYFAPVLGLLKGLTDPVVGLSMGQTAENLARKFSISREEMDAYSLESHARTAQASDAGHLAEIVPLTAPDGALLDEDDGVRRDSTAADLARLRPFFDPRYGNITAANSSQVTDGAAWVVLASARAVEEHGLRPLARIVDSAWAALDPAHMGLGPVHAATPLLMRHGLSLDDIDLWEINEAFAAQVLACLRAWEDDAYCREHLGLNGALGTLDPARLNIDGGAIAIGHPVGASGARIVLHLVNAMRRTGARRGMAAICIGGGQGGALLVEEVA